MRLLLFLLSAGVMLLPAQRLSVGLVGGGSPTAAFNDTLIPFGASAGASQFPAFRSYSASHDYVVGGMLEWRVDPKWSIELDGLFRELHMTTATVLSSGAMNSVSPSPVVTWEFPLLAKYRLLRGRFNPFIEAGPSFRTTGNYNGTHPSRGGLTGGAGVEMPWRSLTIAPTVRYTRWIADGSTAFIPVGTTASDQIELLVAVSRRAESAWRPLGPRMSIGVVAGTNLTRDIRNTVRTATYGFSQSSGPQRPMEGAVLEAALVHGFSVEADALYRPLSSTSTEVFPGVAARSYNYSFVTWEFPVLAKYRFDVGRLSPFAGIGPSFRLPQGLNGSSPFGTVAALGLSFHAGRMLIEPSVRYTHWAADEPFVFGGATRNQSEALVGLLF